jgi:hypothetical protein
MRLFGLTILLCGLTACSYLGLSKPPSVCDTAPSDSVICNVCNDMDVTPESIDLILQASALRGLGEYDRSIVLSSYNDIEKLILTKKTYAGLIESVQEYVELTGPEILLISLYLPKFSSPLQISEFDRALLLSHIESMKVILGSE